VLKEVGAWETLEPHAQFVTVYELANAIQLGSVGSGIIWDNVAAGYEGMTIQRFPELDGAVSTVKIAVLKESTFPEQAELFAEFLANSPKGRAIFGRYGLRSEEVSQ
jgi:ABC-type molybdate transport system substrate-binding protein